MNLEKIRVSVGSASVLGLVSTRYKISPTNCYLMTFTDGKCNANCSFCPQARSSGSSRERLSRINWPTFNFSEFLTKLKKMSGSKKFKRICVQTLNYPENFRDLSEIITQIKRVSDIPISIAIPPMSKEKLRALKSVGVERVGIALDGSTPEVFDKIKGRGVNGPYRWERHFQCLKDALDIFFKGYVSTHIIVGLGETQQDVLKLIEELNNLEILPSLFAFTPIKGTKNEEMNQPEITNYRKIQLARHLIINENMTNKDFIFNQKGELVNFNINCKELQDMVNETKAFLTSGCPDCNRPYYTSRPSGTTFNFPRKLNKNEREEVYNSLVKFVIQ